MSNTILAIVHQDDVPPGHYGATALAQGYEVEVASFADGREPEHPIEEYSGLMVFGGEAQVDEEHLRPWLTREKRLLTDAIEADVPVLGSCLGGQLIAEVSGGWVGPCEDGKQGWQEIALCPEAAEDPIFGSLPATFRTINFHLYHFHLPPRAIPLARASTGVLQAFRLEGKNVWGMQFHAEATHAIGVDWAESIRKLQLPGITEDYLRQYLADNDRFADQQEAVAALLTRRFLDSAATPEHAAPPPTINP